MKHIAGYKLIKELFCINILIVGLSFQAIYASSTYVFFRGYHFLSDAEPIQDLTPCGILSRPIPPEMSEIDAQGFVTKMKQLNKPEAVKMLS